MVLIKYHCHVFHSTNVKSVLSTFGAYIGTLHVLTVPSSEKDASSLITMFGKNLLFLHVRINQLEKFNLILWKSFPVYCYQTWIWYWCHHISFRVFRLNDNADKPSPFCCAITCRLFPNNSIILSTFSSVTEDRLLLEFPWFCWDLYQSYDILPRYIGWYFYREPHD